MYINKFKEFIESLNDSALLESLVDSVKNNGTDDERMVLAEKLIELSDGPEAIDVLEGISNKRRRDAILLFARAYNVMGRFQEEALVLKDAFPPFDSVGSEAFKRLSSIILKNEGMDSFYTFVFAPYVPDTLRISVLQSAIRELLNSGDTLNALEVKSRLKEFEGSDDSLEGN